MEWKTIFVVFCLCVVSCKSGNVISSTTSSTAVDANSTSSTTQLVSSNRPEELKVPEKTNVTPSADPPLPDTKAVEQEHNSSLSIFFVLCVIVLGILLIHLMLQTGFQYIPESIVVVFLGGLIGLFLNILSGERITSWKREEVFSPTGFFLVLLPPIIFESGYNLHKGKDFLTIKIFFNQFYF